MRSSGSASVFRRVRKHFKCRSHEIRPVPSLHRPSTNGLYNEAATCTRNAHAHVLPRVRSMADACAYSVRGARFFIARAVTFLRRDSHLHTHNNSENATRIRLPRTCVLTLGAHAQRGLR